MPYLNIDLDFPEHRKTKRLISILGRGSEAMLLRLWCYVAKYHPEDGRLSDYSPEEIESLAGWVGKSGRMLEVMQKLGWMASDGAGWFIKNWLEHQGHIAAYKAKGRAMAESRWNRVRDAASIAASSAASNALTDPTVPTEPAKGEERAREPAKPVEKPKPAPSAPPTQPSENGSEPTNKPTLEQALAYFRRHAGRFREEEIRECYRLFEATVQGGFWFWGRRAVGDWRAAMEQRILEQREKRGGKKPPQSAGAALSREIERCAKV